MIVEKVELERNNKHACTKLMHIPVELVENVAELLCEISNTQHNSDKAFKCAFMETVLNSWLEKGK